MRTANAASLAHAATKTRRSTLMAARRGVVLRVERLVDKPGPVAGDALHCLGQRNACGQLDGIRKRRVLTHARTRLRSDTAGGAAGFEVPPTPATALRVSRTGYLKAISPRAWYGGVVVRCETPNGGSHVLLDSR